MCSDARPIRTLAGGYELVVEPDELDLLRVERLIAEAREAAPADAAPKLREALALWRGPALADVREAAFAQAETGRLEELRLATAEELADEELALGREAEMIPELERLVAHNPLRERLRSQLMLALYRCRRQADALESYQDARRVLVDELGIEPGRRLRELETAILRQDPVSRSGDAGRADRHGRGCAGGQRCFRRPPEPARPAARRSRGCVRRPRSPILDRRRAGYRQEPPGGRGCPPRARARRPDARRPLLGGGRGSRVLALGSVAARLRRVRHEPSALKAQLGDGAGELAQILPELRELLPGLPEPASVDSEGARFRLFDATARFLHNASESRPIVLVLDDLHAADTPSLLLLQFVARELSDSRILIVGAFRDVDPVPEPALTAMLAEVAREPVTSRMTLRGVTEEDVAAYSS